VALSAVLCTVPYIFVKAFWGQEHSVLTVTTMVFLAATAFTAIVVAYPVLTNRLSLLAWSAIFGVAIGFQVGYLDSMQWDWNRCHFPIPGFMVEVLLLFLLPAKWTVSTLEGKRHLCRATFYTSYLYHSVCLHVVCYVAVRLVLGCILDIDSTLLMSTEYSQSQDLWFCCIGMIIYVVLFLLPVLCDLAACGSVCFIAVYLVLYVCIGVAHGAVANGYFLDEILGLTLVVVAVEAREFTTDSRQIC
jgi:hypothetical protein